MRINSVPSIAGAETTVSSALALLYALASHPDAQRKAQAEIDLVVGMDRLPTVTDMHDLPFVRALVKEVGRWFTVLPLGERQMFCLSIVQFHVDRSLQGYPTLTLRMTSTMAFSFQRGLLSSKTTGQFNIYFDSLDRSGE